jgi:hypothetical protein
MSDIERCAYIKLCTLLHRSPPETLRMLEESYGKAALKKTQVYEWRKHFRDGHARVNDDPRCGLSATSTNDENMSVCAI